MIWNDVRKLSLVVTLGWSVATPMQAAETNGVTLSLSTFLKQVEEQHEGIKASRELTSSAEIKQSEGDLLLSPQLSANIQDGNDRRETANIASQGEATRQQSASVGVGKLFETGTQAKVSYGITHTKIEGVSPAFIPQNEYYTAGPTIEVSQSLWRNWKGQETQTTRDLIAAQAGLTKYQEGLKTKLILADAETTYWRLVLARENVSAQKTTLERFQRMRSWNAKRVSDALADKGDLLQSDAALRAKELELQLAQDEEKAAGRALNLARGKNAEEVNETLETINDHLVDSIVIPAKQGSREDVKAAEQAVKLAEANVRANDWKYTPTLEAFGSVGLNGRDDNFPTANKESFQTSHPLTVLGLRLSAPIDGDLIDRTKSAYVKDRAAAEFTAKRKHLEEELNYRDLRIQFENTKARYKLAESIETAQKEKLDNERQRHRVGRTTTSQVLTFEQDFANAQISRIKIQADVMRIAAQLKTYGGNE